VEDPEVSVPTFFGQSTAPSNSDATTADWPAGHQADDIGILYVEQANEPVSTPAGWTAIEAPGTGTAGAAASTGLQMFWKRAASGAESGVTVANPGDHRRARVLVFRGCETSGSPINVSADDVEATALAAASIPGATTTVDECLIVAAVSNATDSTSNQTTSNGFANADLTSIARVSTGNAAAGNGGGVDIAAGEKAVAGAYGATTVTLATASAQARISFALMPPQGAPPAPPVTDGGIYVATGIKTVAGVVSATTATMDAASVQARIVIALKPPAAPPVNLPPFVEAIADRNAVVDVELGFAVDISDPEGDTLTVTLEAGETSVPTGAAIAQDDDDTWIFTWTPTSTQVGERNIIVRVDDGEGNVVDRAFTITVASSPSADLLAVVRALATRAQEDSEAAESLSTILLAQEQMNAHVVRRASELEAELRTTKEYMASILEALEEEE
jgi:hypothetical protein